MNPHEMMNQMMGDIMADMNGHMPNPYQMHQGMGTIHSMMIQQMDMSMGKLEDFMKREEMRLGMNIDRNWTQADRDLVNSWGQ